MRFLTALLIHVLFWSLVALSIWLISGLDGSLNHSFVETAERRLQIKLAFDDMRGLLLPFASVAFVQSTVLSLIWVLIATRANPINDRQAGAYRGAWAGLFVAAVLTVLGIAWLMIWSRPLQAALQNPTTLALSVGLTVIGVTLAYYLGTAFATRPALGSAVPGAAVLHRLGRRS